MTDAALTAEDRVEIERLWLELRAGIIDESAFYAASKATGRREGMEEAAKICEEKVRDQTDNTTTGQISAIAAEACVIFIRVAAKG